jgi:hypothetical protein
VIKEKVQDDNGRAAKTPLLIFYAKWKSYTLRNACGKISINRVSKIFGPGTQVIK